MKEDSIWTQKILNPKIFSNDKLDNNIRRKLLKIAQDFYKSLDMDLKLKDVLLSGSNVGFNYTKYSDLDVHLLVDFNSIDVLNKILAELFMAKKALWANSHDIIIKGFEVELYVQNINEEHISDGVYSLGKDQWVKKPKYTEPKTDKKLVIQKTKKYIEQIDCLERTVKLSDNFSKVYTKGGKLKANLKQMRKAGLKTKSGIFSIENLIFKTLRNKGYIDKLTNLINKAYDSIFSDKKEGK